MSGIEVGPREVLVLAWDGAEPDGAEVLSRLGVAGDPSRIDIFPAAKIAPVGLDVFLAEGYGIDAAEIAPRKAALDAISGIVVVLHAAAIEGGGGRIEVTPPLSHVATFREARGAVTVAPPISAESARGTLGGKPGAPPKSDARISGMVAAVVLLFLAVFVTVLVLTAD